MKGEKKAIEHLNTVLKNELTAINQYFLHSRMLADMGFGKLAEVEHSESIDEMKHADALIKRILFLEGLPNLQQLNRLRIGESVAEILAGDLEAEREGHKDLRAGIADCEKLGDYVSRNLLRGILESEEEHIDWLETQLALIEKIGPERYMQSQMTTGED